MAMTSYPFDGQSITEDQYTRLFGEFQQAGVSGRDGNQLRVSGNGSGMHVFVNPGFAVVRGHGFLSTAQEQLSISAAGVGDRIDYVVLKLDPGTNSVTLEVKTGVVGGGAPSLTQSETGIYEMGLAIVHVPGGAVTINAGQVIDDRVRTGYPVSAWYDFSRPKSPRVGQLGFNMLQNVFEYWTGGRWSTLATEWDSIVGKPLTFTPSGHTHAWSSITERPTSFPPSAHSHSWGSITSKPSSFNPSSHTHPGSQITSSVDKADDAWGTDNAHIYAAGGDGPWYSVWVNADYRFMRNTSSIRFKENVRDIHIDPKAVLNLQPRLYDRKEQTDPKDGSTIKGNKDEFGLIAEEVNDFLPELVVRDAEGRIDALRYDLLAVAMIPTLKALSEKVEALEAEVKRLRGDAE